MTNAERWEAAIQKTYEKRVLRYPDSAIGWRLLYSPRRVLDGARVAFLGLNPGGRSLRPEHGEFSSEAGSAYRREIESWGASSPLQDQVMEVFRRLKVTPEDVLAGNLVPFRSSREVTLAGRREAIAFGESLWREILGEVRPQIVVSMHRHVNGVISKLLGVRSCGSVPTGWGNVTGMRGEFGRGGIWIGLPQLSQYKIMKRSESQQALDHLFSGLA